MNVNLLNIFFDNWHSVFATFITTVMAYIILITMLRISGKRTLAKMNAFDFIVTIALGSTFATVCLSKDVTLVNGVLVLLMLIVMQFIITWLSVRVTSIKNLVTSQPALLLYKGEVLHAVLKKERVSKEELYVAIRNKGINELKEVDAIVLETTGDLTVIANITSAHPDVLKEIKNYPVKNI